MMDKKRMKVLLIAQSCSLQDDKDNPGLTGRTERLHNDYCADQIQLAVAYMTDGIHDSLLYQNGITYYGVDADMRVGLTNEGWETTKQELLRVINDFKPDLIYCFGSEWPYGAIAEDVDIPVVIHMMGFLNIYFPSIHMARGDFGLRNRRFKHLRSISRHLVQLYRPKVNSEELQAEFERRVMSSNKFFMGRTEWDRRIVRYYSPGSKYYYVPEVIKPYIYNSAHQWNYHCGEKIRLFTLSSADDRKGNEIMLRTAKLLKDIVGLDIEWIVAGHKEFFARFEQITSICREDVGIELIGMIGSKQIVEEMKAADFFIHPSIMDNSPNSICEAQLIGCPVIASNVGGVPDLVKDGETGFLYPYNEPHTLAFMIADLYSQKDYLSRISEKASETALKRHDPELIANNLVQTYKQIIADNKKQ